MGPDVRRDDVWIGSLLQRRNDARMLELRDIHFWQHSCLRIDVEHFLDRREVRRRTRIPAEIIVLEEIGIEYRYRSLQHFGDHLERLLAIGQRLLHAGGY